MRRPPRSTRTVTLFPYTTLFLSRHILIVLVAAKLAAEVAERLGIPAVVGEILAGILIGPSLLNAVGGGDEVLRTLGEIGVILRSEEHTSELQSLMRISYAVFCLTKKNR